MDQIFTRHRFDVRRRTLSLRDKSYLTPRMIRLVLEGEDLADFTSLSPDDHIKLIFPTGTDRPAMRDYTPRAFDRAERTLTLDFAVHEAGPATRWALDARPGDRLEIGGPRGSQVVTAAFDWWLLIADETGLPALGPRVEELGADTKVITLGLVADAAEEQRFVTRAEHEAHWLHRGTHSADPAPALAAAGQIVLPAGGRGFIWIAAEAGVARALRDHFAGPRSHPRGWIKAAGYWIEGQADASDKTLD